MSSRRLFFLLAVPTVLLLCVVLARVRRESYRRDKAAGVARKVAVARQWATSEFIEIAPTPAFMSALASVPVRDGTNLTDVAKQKLPDTFYNFFMAFNDGSYEAYVRFRRP